MAAVYSWGGVISNGNDHMMNTLRRVSSAATPDVKSNVPNDNRAQARSRSNVNESAYEKPAAPSFRGLVMEYYGPGQRLREIYLSSREGDKFPVPITLAVQLSPTLREFVDVLMVENATRTRLETSDSPRNTLDVPCSTDVLKTLVEFITAKLELELKLSEEGKRMTEEQKREHWREYMYSRVAWRNDLDDFADDILQVADFLTMKSLYDLMKCCFRLRL